MLTIGLTGGVASGKTTVAAQFATRGVPIVDTDLIARALVAPGQPALAEIAAHFGPRALLDDGNLNRSWLRKCIFANEAERQALGAILHPRIHAEVVRQLERLNAPYAIVVIPLLVENAAYDDMLDHVLVVDVPENVQFLRLTQRDMIDEPLARAMIATQATRADRLARADEVIDNSGTPDAIEPQVERLHGFYTQLARN